MAPRMVWNGSFPARRAVSTVDRRAASASAAHLARYPLVTFRWMTLGRSVRSLTLLVASTLPAESQKVSIWSRAHRICPSRSRASGQSLVLARMASRSRANLRFRPFTVAMARSAISRASMKARSNQNWSRIPTRSLPCSATNRTLRSRCTRQVWWRVACPCWAVYSDPISTLGAYVRPSCRARPGPHG